MANENNVNLVLWDLVSKTDPLFTKPAKKGAFHFTSIAPIYQFKMATEQFGIQGIGWGVKIGSEVFEEKAYDTTIILSYDATLFFVFDGVRGEIPIHASEKSCYKTQGANGYMKIDDEVRKKVVTNAKTKGLSELGFNADVFMGMFDDPNYVDFRNYEESIEKADDRAKDIAEKTTELNAWCKAETDVYQYIKNKSALIGTYSKHIESLTNKCNLLGLAIGPYKAGFKKSYDNQVQSISDKLIKKDA